MLSAHLNKDHTFFWLISVYVSILLLHLLGSIEIQKPTHLYPSPVVAMEKKMQQLGTVMVVVSIP